MIIVSTAFGDPKYLNIGFMPHVRFQCIFMPVVYMYHDSWCFFIGFIFELRYDLSKHPQLQVNLEGQNQGQMRDEVKAEVSIGGNG